MDPLFFILGFLDEYGGRNIVEGSDLVEHFFGDERDKTSTFKSHVSELAEERGINTTIREEVTEGDCTDFYSRELADLINGCYTFDFAKSIYVAIGSEPRRTEARLSKEVLEQASDDEKLSFLAGAYVRYGKRDTFRLANAKHKAEIVADLLQAFGCRGVNLSLANPGYVPSIFEVTFNPSEEVKQKLAPYWSR